MIKFDNVTNLKDFRGMVESGKYEIEKISPGKVRIKHNLYTTPYNYILEEVENGLYKFYSENDIFFGVLFRSNSNHIEILEGEKDGRKYKADKFLKQFGAITCLANSALLTFDLF